MKHSKILVLTLTSTDITKLAEGEVFFVENSSGKYDLYRIDNKTNFVSTTTVQSAIENGWATLIRSGFVEPTLKVYQAGVDFHINELFTDDTKSKFFVALQNFTATGNFSSDKDNGYFKEIGAGVYKQVEATVSANEVFYIPLVNQNNEFNKHCFVEVKKPPQSNVTALLTDFDETETKFQFDINWMNLDGNLYLKNIKTYSTTKFTNSNNVEIFEKTIDTNDYVDIKYIGATAY